MQGTSTKWKARRDRANIQPEIPVEKFATVERAIREAERFDLLLLDGPAHTEPGGRNMAKAADLVLMPTGYGLDDLEEQAEAAYELEEYGINHNKIWFVFCRTTGSPAEDQAARDYLSRAKINVFGPVLSASKYSFEYFVWVAFISFICYGLVWLEVDHDSTRT